MNNKQELLNKNTAIIKEWSEKNNVEFSTVQPYQIRLVARHGMVDVFPKSKKFHNVTSNERGNITGKITDFLDSEFKEIAEFGLAKIECSKTIATAHPHDANTAINNTYGIGINPESIPEIINALDELLNKTGFANSMPKRAEHLKRILSQAKI